MNTKINPCAGILLTLILFCKDGTAQDSSDRTAKPIFTEVMLLYDFPQSFGAAGGINLPLRSLIKKKNSRQGKPFIKPKDVIYGANAGFYRYPFNYTGVFFAPFIGFRHYVHPSLFHETTLGIGVLRTFYDGIVYKVDAAGNVSEANLFGRSYVTISFSWAINFLLRKPGKSIMAVQVKPLLWLQYPYNSFIKPHIALEAGIKYELARKSVQVKTRTKYKR